MNEKPKRILHVVGAMNRAGAESMLMTLYRELDKTEVQFDFLEFTGGRSDFHDEIEELGGQILKCDWSQSLTRVRQTRRSIALLIDEEGPYTAVHSHILFASGTVLAAAKDAGVPTRIAHSHSSSSAHVGFKATVYQKLARLFINRGATSVVACSSEAGRYLFGQHFSARGGTVIPNAIDPEMFYPREVNAEGETAAEVSKISLISVARLEFVKNHTFLLELAQELRIRGVEYQMNFVGTGTLQDELETEIDRLGLGNHVKMLGLRDNVAEILRGSDVMLMPSLWEGLPVTLVEAQATGLPCIVSDSVTREVDLGLGLLSFQPLDNVGQWADTIANGFPILPTAEEIAKALETRGYTVRQSLANLLALYGPHQENNNR